MRWGVAPLLTFKTLAFPQKSGQVRPGNIWFYAKVFLGTRMTQIAPISRKPVAQKEGGGHPGNTS